MESATTLLRLCLKRASTLHAMVAANNCSLEIEIEINFEGTGQDLPFIKLQNVVPF